MVDTHRLLPQRLRPTWMEVDLDNVAHNVREIRRVIGTDRLLIAVAKGNAYGLGLLGVVPTLVQNGADIVAVGRPEDAIQLRDGGCEAPLLLFGSYLPEIAADDIVGHEIIPSVWDLSGAEVFSRAARKRMDVFLEIDTGFHRLGVAPEEAAEVAKRIEQLPNLHILCVHTHFAAALDLDFVEVQFERFHRTVEAIRATGVEAPFACAASSAVVSMKPHMYMNAVDPGRLLYGLYYPANPHVSLNLAPGLRAVRSRIIQTKWVEQGETMGYGRVSRSYRTRVGVLPFGWGDGMSSSIADKAMVLIRGKRCPIVGAPNIEHSLVDLTDATEAVVGDEVIFIGVQDDEAITLSEQAAWAGVTELATLIQLGRTTPQIYYKNGTWSAVPRPRGGHRGAGS